MSPSKVRVSRSRKVQRWTREAQEKAKKVNLEPNTMAAKPVPAPEVKNPHAAAIDVHSDNHVVCVGPDQVRTFGAYTVDLHAVADHLKQHGVTTVVLESTGVYWVPLFELLESRGFEVFLIEATPRLPMAIFGPPARPPLHRTTADRTASNPGQFFLASRRRGVRAAGQESFRSHASPSPLRLSQE